MALSTDKPKQPGWKANQQKQTKAETTQARTSQPSHRMIKLNMLTDYRNFAKKGQTWETDEEKAAELVRLGRAKYAAEKKGK